MDTYKIKEFLVKRTESRIRLFYSFLIPLTVFFILACQEKKEAMRETTQQENKEAQSEKREATQQVQSEQKIEDELELNRPFEDYKVTEIYDGMPAEIDFSSSPGSDQFKTRYIDGTKSGTNFAGQYALITWGCGSGCQVISLVNILTGKISTVPFTASMGVEFRKDSRLLIVNPLESSDLARFFDKDFPAYAKPAYYKWESDQFVPLPELDRQAVLKKEKK